jgi:ABC-type glycerol-3-phosphate transport system permease component
MVIDSQIRRAKNQMHVNRIPRTVILCVACIITIFPILWILLTSFKDTLDISAYPPAVIFSPTLKNYQRVLQIDNFGAYFKDSIIVAIASTLFATFLGSLTCSNFKRNTHILKSVGDQPTRLYFFIRKFGITVNSLAYVVNL